MRSWDASAVVPLLVAEPGSQSMLGLLKVDRAMITWWATPIECVSALCRRDCHSSALANASPSPPGARASPSSAANARRDRAPAGPDPSYI